MPIMEKREKEKRRGKGKLKKEERRRIRPYDLMTTMTMVVVWLVGWLNICFSLLLLLSESVILSNLRRRCFASIYTVSMYVHTSHIPIGKVYILISLL